MPAIVSCPQVEPGVLNLQHRPVVQAPEMLFESSGAREAARTARVNSRQGQAPPSTTPYEEKCLRVQLSDMPDEYMVPLKVPNGFVHTLATAYNEHIHLVIRPDDVWHAMLTQFSLYVQANSEALRNQFVSHDGQKELQIEGVGTIWTADFASMSQEMGRLLGENVKDPDLRSWLMPDFSTTTSNDATISSLIMMATLKNYFTYRFNLRCSIPSVTLEGTVEDWLLLRSKVDKFAEFGEEPTKWVTLLQPVCDSFVACFDEDKVEESREFWSRVCHYAGGGSGPTFLCGWSTVFTVWNNEGKWQGDWSKKSWNVRPWEQEKHGQWPLIDTQDIASGVAEVAVIVNDSGTIHHTVMMAGLPGTSLRTNNDKHSVIRPISGWCMMEVPPFPDASS